MTILSSPNIHSWWLHHKYEKEVTLVGKMSSETYPRKFVMNEVVILRGLTGDDEKLNGQEGTIERLAYIHPENSRIMFNVRVQGQLMCFEPWNLKKSDLEPYDGNKVLSWEDPRCVWKPDPNFKRSQLPDDWDSRNI